MKKVVRNVLLSTLIIVPMVAILFLYGFGRNKYALDVYYPQWIEEVEIDGENFMTPFGI